MATAISNSSDAQSAANHKPLPVHLRWMIRRDMAEVHQIERASFEFPWHDDQFIEVLRQRNCIGTIAEHGKRIIGFTIHELHKNRLHVLNIAVLPEFRRCGVGRQMIEKLAKKLSRERRSKIMLEIREKNLPAQCFFRAMGFRAVSVLRDFYNDTPEDAYLFQLRYTSAAAAGPADPTA